MSKAEAHAMSQASSHLSDYCREYLVRTPTEVGHATERSNSPATVRIHTKWTGYKTFCWTENNSFWKDSTEGTGRANNFIYFTQNPGDEFIFFKWEPHGTKGVVDNTKHGLDYFQSLKRRHAQVSAPNERVIVPMLNEWDGVCGCKDVNSYRQIVRSVSLVHLKPHLSPETEKEYAFRWAAVAGFSYQVCSPFHTVTRRSRY